MDIAETETFGPSAFPIPGLRADAVYSPAEFGRPDPLVMRFASSAAHVEGRPLASVESCTWLGEHFQTSLAQIKPELDQLFAAGINHVLFHGSTYSPPDEPWPGLTFYASTDLNPGNRVWGDLSELNAYLTRVQSIVQDGHHDNDVLLYFPQHDLWHDPGDPLIAQLTVHGAQHWLHDHRTGFGAVARQLDRAGWQFDYVSDRMLDAVTVEDGLLCTPGGRYATVLVPGAALMPLATVERLVDLAHAGATVIFDRHLPRDVPGLADLAARRARLRELLAGITHTRCDCGADQTWRVGSATVVVGADVEAALHDTAARRESVADRGCGCCAARTATAISCSWPTSAATGSTAGSRSPTTPPPRS